MDNAECKITIRDIIDNNTEGGEVVNLIDVLVVLGEFFVKRIN